MKIEEKASNSKEKLEAADETNNSDLSKNNEEIDEGKF